MSETKLQPHQLRVLEKLHNQPGVLVYHGLGSGKTLTGLAAAKVHGGASVIGPASLKGNFDKENEKHKVKADVDYSTYSKPTPARSNLVIYDEAHRMGRAGTKRSKYPEKFPAKKVMLLTGTPIRNEPSELIPLLKAIDADVPSNRKDFYEKYITSKEVKPGFIASLLGVKPGVVQVAQNLTDFKSKLRGKVDYYMAGKENYPNVQESDVKVPMSEEQLKAYKTVTSQNKTLAYKIKNGIPPSKAEAKQMNAFLNATRQISNSASQYNVDSKDKVSPKVQKILSDIKESYAKDPNYKGVTYSNYLDSGINRVSKRLSEEKIPHALFTGKVSQKNRKQIIEQYNKGQIKQLLISGAGSEGLDLKGTKMVQLMEPH
jgi:SNF2 family DNA or RNA helicase